ncbi:MAG: hypothetical protein U9N87_08985, partial [Planctomycetota bacterium]|nr:hypothetical protein [Planctomycetota bacterium]
DGMPGGMPDEMPGGTISGEPGEMPSPAGEAPEGMGGGMPQPADPFVPPVGEEPQGSEPSDNDNSNGDDDTSREAPASGLDSIFGGSPPPSPPSE